MKIQPYDSYLTFDFCYDMLVFHISTPTPGVLDCDLKKVRIRQTCTIIKRNQFIASLEKKKVCNNQVEQMIMI